MFMYLTLLVVERLNWPTKEPAICAEAMPLAKTKLQIYIAPSNACLPITRPIHFAMRRARDSSNQATGMPWLWLLVEMFRRG
jgi:hypothetical protein